MYFFCVASARPPHGFRTASARLPHGFRRSYLTAKHLCGLWKPVACLLCLHQAVPHVLCGMGISHPHTQVNFPGTPSRADLLLPETHSSWTFLSVLGPYSPAVRSPLHLSHFSKLYCLNTCPIHISALTEHNLCSSCHFMT